MLVVALLLLVVAVVLAVLLVRTRAEVDAAKAEVAEARRAQEVAAEMQHKADSEADDARKERDDALERVNRARRDASEVAKRMTDEVAAREAADAARLEAEAERERIAEEREELAARLDRERAQLVAELEAAEAAAEAAATGGTDEQVGELWSLALAGVRRTWEVSVAPSPGMPCPLDDTDDELRTAVGIEVDAAREEAGAAIELEWTGDAPAPPSIAVRTLSIVQEIIGRLAKTADDAVLRVDSAEHGITLELAGSGVGEGPVVPADIAAEHQVEPGRFFIPS